MKTLHIPTTRIYAVYRTILRLLLLILGMILGFVSIPAKAAEVPVIAAASDLKFAVEDIARQFTKDTGLGLKLSFGSSGNFFRQICQGGPFELFMSADEQHDLAKQNMTIDQGVLYAIGRLYDSMTRT